MSIANYHRDRKGRWLGSCLYCLRIGRANNLRRLPYDKLDREYCPNCFYEVLKHNIEERKRYQDMIRRSVNNGK